MATIHPILNYDYLIRVLYNVRVYYGNCIHYAQNSSLKDEDFVGIPTQGKKIAYEDIMRFAREKLNRVKQTKTLVDNLYNNYNRMVERYSVCRRMFTEFCELYPSEKQAHLRLQQQDIALLNQLAMQFDSLQLDIKAFEHSLQQYPIEGYHPTFIYNKIQLYRLDGLKIAQSSIASNQEPITGLAQGLYIINIYGRGKCLQTKILIQRF